jgi:hypothetical protein
MRSLPNAKQPRQAGGCGLGYFVGLAPGLRPARTVIFEGFEDAQKQGKVMALLKRDYIVGYKSFI